MNQLAANDLVSVIIPCYNSQNTIIHCVQSVIDQTYKNIEIIIIDDGSNDDSVAILKKFLNKHEHRATFFEITIIKQENSGPSIARNNGLKNAKGNYIAFLDADDYWIPEKIEMQLKVLADNPESSFIGGGYNDNIKNRKEYISKVSFVNMLYSNFFATPTVLLKKSILNGYEFNTGQNFSEDYLLWLQISLKHKCLYIRTKLSGSIMQRLRYGDLGLSANLWKMEQGELKNYLKLKKDGHINLFQLVFFSTFSFFKFLIRLIRVSMFKFISSNKVLD